MAMTVMRVASADSVPTIYSVPTMTPPISSKFHAHMLSVAESPSFWVNMIAFTIKAMHKCTTPMRMADAIWKE